MDMKPETNLAFVKKLMAEFAASTGLSNAVKPARRYLWTDAFAVCNFLELYCRTGDESWRNLALGLVDQVHCVLGRHRPDDPRSGWISGLSEEDGQRHPTGGGLRIGKQLGERGPAEPYDDRLEWDRDGQYFHYLTKWMHALSKVSRAMENPLFNLWAMELARAAHAGFVHVLADGSKRMYWKMSIDLSRPLVPSMGLHDPLDGWITFLQLQSTALEFSKTPALDLGPEIADMRALCQGKTWTTEDPLGIGGLLSDAYKTMQLIAHGGLAETALLNDLLEASLPGLEACSGSRSLKLPADYRLAFRELGLAIGLRAVERIEGLMAQNPKPFAGNRTVQALLKHLKRYAGLGEALEEFWLAPQNRQTQTWIEHLDINSVMLATCLAPDGYLQL